MYNVITKRCVAVRIRRRGGRGVFIFRHWNRFVCKFSGVDVTVDNRGRRRALLPFHGTDTDNVPFDNVTARCGCVFFENLIPEQRGYSDDIRSFLSIFRLCSRFFLSFFRFPFFYSFFDFFFEIYRYILLVILITI